jgi:cytochrome c peroxidase
MNKKFAYLLSLALMVIMVHACTKDGEDDNKNVDVPNTNTPFVPTPYQLRLPLGWPSMVMPSDNPLTEEGVELGRKLFYDPILSLDNSISCASCHKQEFAFSDNKKFSIGINGQLSERNSMPIFNLSWVQNFAPVVNGRPLRFFWDGSSPTLEEQALKPITNPLEMGETLPNVIRKLNEHPTYPQLFKRAFGADSITTTHLAKAISQFERIIISSGAKIDRYFFNPETGRRFDTTVFTEQERRGMLVFNTEEKGDCFHCHNVSSPFSSNFNFHNNGHRSNDEGLKRVTGNTEDIGKFRTPSLRNLVYTAPYMHDGSIATLEEVVEHYNSGVVRSFPTDALYLKHPDGLNLSEQEKADLVAFLKTMSDPSLTTNQKFSKP